jgi:HEAT repeat protein
MIKKPSPVLLVCLLAIFLSCGCSKKKEEVTYQGKPLSEWMKMLNDKKPHTKLEAIIAIKEIGPAAREAIPELIETIRKTRNQDKRFLFASVNALLALGKEIVPHMISLLKDDDWEMRRGSAWILGKLGPEDRDAVPALTEALNDTNVNVRMKASEALKKLKGEAVELAKPGSNSKVSPFTEK